MQSQSRLIWMGLIIAISFGLVIEALKTTKNSGGSMRSNLFGLQELEDDGVGARHGSSRENREKADRARTRLLRGRLAGLSGTQATLAPAATEIATVTPTPSGVPNLAAPQTINAVEAAKKKAAEDAKKKKKKKKKKATEPTAQLFVQPPTPNADTSSDKSNDVSGGSSMYGGGSGHIRSSTFTAGAAAAVNENPETLEEWVAYIMPEPNYERTMKLIKAQQEHSIDSDIFHEVVAQMLADSRDKMHEYAILALGSSPSLKSFLLLQAANSAQSDGSSLRLMSRTYLKAYSKLENVRFLGSAIASQTEANSISFEAMRLIQTAVTTYKPKPTTPTNGQPTTSATPASVTRQFTPLIAVLTRVSLTATDAALRQEAGRTLEQVQSLVGTGTSAVASTVAPAI